MKTTNAPATSSMQSNAPYEEYGRRSQAREEARAACDTRHRSHSYGRLGVVAVAILVAAGAFGEGWFSGWWLLAPAVGFFWLGGRMQALEEQRAVFSRAIGFYERALARLEGRWAGTGESGERFLDDHHLYAGDLDIFGHGSLFQLLCQARTGIGEGTLAAWLTAPAPPEAVRARQQCVAEIGPKLDLREDLAVLGEAARSGVHPRALADWGEGASVLDPNGFRRVARGLSALGVFAVGIVLVYLATLAALPAGVFVIELPPGVVAGMATYFVVVAALCGSVTWRFAAPAGRILQESEEAARDLGLLAGVLERFEAEAFTSPRLVSLQGELETDGVPPSRRIARLKRLIDFVEQRDNLFVRLLGPLVLWDLHLAYALEDWRRVSGAALRHWLDAVGEMEAMLSLAAYHYERPGHVFPEFVEQSPVFEAEALSHPLLPEADAVPNDVSIGRRPRVLVVSGSNMSGKSTLLRTVGANAVLAQAGAPVRARSLRLSPLAVGASIQAVDSLQQGESRFYAEILRLGAIVEQATDGQATEELPVLFLIDELLHGTNSHDRRIGAEAIVRGLVERGAFGLVTTHDLALTHIADGLGDQGANVHFEDHLEGGKMRFDYRMRAGVVEKSNALELMRSVGLDV